MLEKKLKQNFQHPRGSVLCACLHILVLALTPHLAERGYGRPNPFPKGGIVSLQIGLQIGFDVKLTVFRLFIWCG